MADKLKAHSGIYDGVRPEEAESLYNALKTCGYVDRNVFSKNSKAYFEGHLQLHTATDLVEIDIIAAELFGFFVDLRVSVNGKNI